jgi:2',3'-cyclic-nucleotide 2'-phosphodiesterase (5'-nucleotidase family)
VVSDIVDAVNESAADLRGAGGCGHAEGCDLVVMLVHEGAASTSYAAVTNDSTFANIVRGASPDIDAIVSGHTHLAYNHKVPVQAWVDEHRAVTERPVVSAGQYGAYLNRLRFDFEPGTDNLVDIRQGVVSLKDFDADPATQGIVDAAVAAAAGPGGQRVGELEGPFKRARRFDPDSGSGGANVENRGGESTLGNLVAEIQRWRTGAQIGLMNPGGLRADLLGNDGNPRVLTYRQAADVQPFANTLVTMDLTGGQIRTILEQQWQRDADGNIPSRPFLRLGTSDGFVVTEDATRAEGHRVTGMWLNGEAIDLDETYRVAATSFLASGTGDNFWGFADATNRQDTGQTDLAAVVDYFEERTAPLPVDYRQHAVRVRFPSGAPAAYVPGDHATFDVTSWAMTGADDVTDESLQVRLGDRVLGTFDVGNALPNLPDDTAGTASIDVQVPVDLEDGATKLLLVGETTGTEIPVVIQVDDGIDPVATVAAGPDQAITWDQAASIPVQVSGNDGVPTGSVRLLEGDTELASAPLADGAATLSLAARTLEPGTHSLRVVYSGPGYPSAEDEMTLTVEKAAATVSVDDVSLTYGDGADVIVQVAPAVATGTVYILDGTRELTAGTVSNGTANLRLPARSLSPGTTTLTASYTGDGHVAGASTAFTATVGKAASRTSIAVTPREVEVKKTRAIVWIAVTTPAGVVATGDVAVTVPGQGTERVTLWGGLAALTLDTFSTVGPRTIEVEYGGSALLAPSSDTVVIEVVKPGKGNNR